jgi:hypothetical protein
MKKIIATILLLGVFCRFIEAEENKNPLMASETIVWAGLDYSMLHIIGNPKDIKVPDMLFQDMPRKWNDLFLDERLDGVANSLNKRVFIDIGGVMERNAIILTNRNIFESDTADALEKTYLTRQDIAAEISSYKMEHTNGLGLVFIVDGIFYHHGIGRITVHSDAGSSLLPTYAEGVNIVFFDIATREIISAKREVKTVGTGGSYRFFWFGPIKDTDSGLAKYR